MTNFNSGAGGQVNYYLAGFLLGMGKKHRAAEQDIWREQQGQANLGICDCEWMQEREMTPLSSYRLKALSLLPSDLWANYRLGLIYVEQANARTQRQRAPQRHGRGRKPAERSQDRTCSNVIAVNPDTDEASRARQYISRIDSALGSP